MGKPYSNDLRERVVAAVQSGGLSCNQAAKQFGVAISTAINWVNRLRETGSVAPGKMGGHKPRAISGEHRVWLLQRIKDGDFTLRGLVVELAERGLKVDYRSVWEFVHAEKLSFKKSVVAGERDRPDVARRRAQWTKYQGRIEPERLVFIDETWTKTNMAPLRGWAPCGERLIAKVPHGRWKTTTFLAALRHDRIDAPWLLEGPIDGESFRTYVEKVLLPTLREGDIVIMDNLGSHKGKAVRALIRSAGAKLFFLPKYSPDLNPIEQVFAKLKHLLRKAAARTVEAICIAVGELLGTFSAEECANYFSNSGYQA
ncbi:MAG: IS630 family transposase [Pseudolabrys sp.]